MLHVILFPYICSLKDVFLSIKSIIMKKQIFAVSMTVLLATGVAFAAIQQEQVMYKQADGTYVVNTTSLTPNVKGFKGATPLEVYIKNNKVVKVEALPNRESPKFFDRVKQVLLPKFNGMKVAKAAKAQTGDGATGATYSSRAVKENVAAAVAYYKKNK